MAGVVDDYYFSGFTHGRTLRSTEEKYETRQNTMAASMEMWLSGFGTDGRDAGLRCGLSVVWCWLLEGKGGRGERREVSRVGRGRELGRFLETNGRCC